MGVKNGINAFGKKNFLGTFAPPFAVHQRLELASTLSDRDWRARHLGSGQGRAHPGSRVVRLARTPRRGAPSRDLPAMAR